MKVLLMSAAILVASAISAIADPVEGLWQTIPDDNGNFGHVKIVPCDGGLCGALVKAFGTDGKPVDSDNIGKMIVWNMENLGEGNYGNGKIWSPDRDKIYNGKMHLVGDKLTVSGCVMGICRDGGTWVRVN